jgi:hypothetical protein
MAVLGVLLQATGGTAFAAAETTWVLPVVVRGVAGSNGSFWDSEVRLLRLRGTDPVTVARVWVATAEGGFEDPTSGGPTWHLGAGRMLILTGSDLLQGVTASHAAVALRVSGAAEVWWRNADTQGEGRLPVDDPCCLPGSGQLGRGLTAALSGPSLLLWMTSGNQVFRDNVGLINPSALPMTVALGPVWLRSSQQVPGVWGEGYQELEPTTVTLPPWGWKQLNNVLWTARPYCPFPSCQWLTEVAPVVGRVVPAEAGRPYYAYASVLYSPRNDPEFIPAVPGMLPPTDLWP